MDKKKNTGWNVLERARRKAKKNQQDPVSPPMGGPSPNYLLNIMLSEPIQIPSEKRFRNLLDFLKSKPQIHNYDFNPELAQGYALSASLSGLPLLASPEHRRYFLTILNPSAIKIMESRIFYNGGLKGADNHGGGLRYESYPVKDLDQFIYDLSGLLSFYETKVSGWPSEFQVYFFSEGVRYLDLFTTGVRMFKGRRAAQPFKTMLRALKSLKKEVSAKPDSPPRASRSALKQEVADVFHKHIQEAPGTVIAERAAELLTLFGIETEPDSIRKKLPRKKHTS